MNKQPLIDQNGEVRELTDKDFAAMRPAAEVVPDIVAHMAYAQTQLWQTAADHRLDQNASSKDETQLHQTTIDSLQSRYGMTYEQFETYLQHRADKLLRTPNKNLNQAIMREENDALDWKAAREMLSASEKI